MKKSTIVQIAATALSLAFGTAFAADAVDSTKEKGREVKQDVKGAAHKTGRFVEDSAITATVKTKLIADKTTKAHDIKVETKNGVVELTGTVDSSAESKKAESIAQSVDGVQSVKNELTTK